MSLSAQAGTTVVALATAVTAVSLWRGADRHAGPIKRGYWLLGLAALLFGTGAVGEQELPNAAAGAAFPLSLADLPGLLALPVLVAGVASLRPRREAGWHPLAQRRPGRAGTVVAHLADGYVLASALFIICWLAVFSAVYPHSGDDAGMFAAQLVHPLADLFVLGGLPPLAVAAVRRGLAPFAALLLVTVSDALSVGARVSSGHPGILAQATLVAGLIALGAAPWLAAGRGAGSGDPAQPGWAGLGTTTALAVLAAVAAALVLISWALAGRLLAQPVLAVAGGTLLLALLVRVAILVHRDSVRSRLWQEAGQQFRELADRTSDAVLVCDYAGLIGYASPAVREYGYTPEGLAGQPLDGLVHPEDRPAGVRAVREVAGAPAGPIRYACRVRAADGTWRYVEATISRQRSQGAPDRLLITARDVSDQVALRRQIAHLTYHDGLTGLPNRAYLEDRAREALSPDGGEAPGAAGVILVSLDGFAVVNDLAGPSAGDLVLSQVARRLRAVVPPRGTAGRWGGDEFAVLLAGTASAQEAIDCAERILDGVSAEPFRAADQAVSLSASVGVALADGSPAGHLWRNADAAVRRAKEAGGGRLEVYAAVPDGNITRWPALAVELRRALAGGQLELDYQPVADLATSRVTAVTALPRWPWHGTGVPPGELLDVAARSGVSAELGKWVLGESCAQVAAWRRAGWDGRLWLRCAPRQVSAPGFTQGVLEALSASGLAPDALILEVPRPVLAEGGDLMLRGLGELRERGTRLALDVSAADAGSLARLGQLPVDRVRIGPALVAGLGADAAAETLIRALVRICTDLGLEVLADGIERAGQRDLLAAMGCAAGMGPLLGPPLPAGSGGGLDGDPGQEGREPPFGVISPAETNALSS